MKNDSSEGGLFDNSKLLVLACTYNERENLPELLHQIRAAIGDVHILIVDDNSPDKSADWVREQQTSNLRLHLIERSGKLGLGTAIAEGMRYAIENGYEWLVNLDADLSHDPKVINDMIAISKQADLVIGSRYVAGGGLQGCTWRRKFVSQCANFYAKRIIGWSIQDCSSAFRIYRVSELAKIQLSSIRAAGYGFLEECLWRLMDRGARIVEIPIIYTERREGKSKISIREAGSTIAALHRVARMKHRKRDPK